MLKKLFDSISDTLIPNAPTTVVGVGPYHELLQPILEGAGVELIHEEEYAVIQDELSKRGGIDDSVVLGNAIMLLRDRGKDLRAVSFMALSALRTEGVPALAPVLGLMASLIITFADALHPRKHLARRASIEWLCNERFIDVLTLRAKAANQEDLTVLQQAVEGVLACVRMWPTEARPDLSGLILRIEQWLSDKARVELREAVVRTEEIGAESRASRGNSESAVSSAVPGNADEAWATVRKASVALRADARWAGQACSLMRASRWSALLLLPPNEQGLTRFSPPRKESRMYLDGLVGNSQWALVIEETVKLFNEGANHLWLDLWRLYDQANSQLSGDANLRSQLALDLRALLARAPKLPHLKYDDGFDFATTQTRGWLDTLVRPTQPTSGASDSNAAKGPDAKFSEARKCFETDGLASALNVMQQALSRTTSYSDRFECQRVMLQLAIDGDRPDLAIGLARTLAERITEFSLDRWLPETSFDVLSILLSLLRGHEKASQAEVDTAYWRMCNLDAARAAHF